MSLPKIIIYPPTDENDKGYYTVVTSSSNISGAESIVLSKDECVAFVAAKILNGDPLFVNSKNRIDLDISEAVFEDLKHMKEGGAL